MIGQLDRYRIVEEPTGTTYGLLLDFMVAKANAFSLVLVGSGRKSRRAQAVLHDLNPYLLEASQTSEWPGTRLMEGYVGSLHRFTVNSNSVALVRGAANALYSWHAPELPDDLCFYRIDGRPLLSSTAHERESDLCLDAAEYTTLIRLVPSIKVARVLEN